MKNAHVSIFNSCSAILCLSLLLIPGVCPAQDPPPNIPGVPDLQWGATWGDVQAHFPNTVHQGNIFATIQPWADFPEDHKINGHYFVNAETNQLKYVEFQPAYTYENREYWNVDYQHIEHFVTDVYGEPVKRNDEMILWQHPPTQGRLIMFPNGWMARFDHIQEGE